MINVSDDYKTAIYKTPIYSKISGTITLTNGDTVDIYDNASASNIVKDSLSINNKCVSRNKLEYGCAYVGELNISLYNDIDRNALYNGVIELSYFLKLEDNTFEEVPLGVFIISEAVRTKQIVKIKAYDKMQLLDKSFISVETFGEPFALLEYIADITGIELAQTQAEIEALPNGDRFSTITEDANYMTYRDIISDIATMLCCFATMTRDGKLKFVPFALSVTEEIPQSRRANTNIAEKVINYDSLKMTVNNTIYTVVKTGQEEGTNVLEMDSAEIIGAAHADDYILVTLQTMIDNISLLNYTPITCEIVSNPALELGDMLKLTSGNTTEAYAPLMSYEWHYHGRESIKAVGETEAKGQSKTSRIAAGTQEAIANVATVIYTYENARAFNLNSIFTQIIRIDFVSRNATKGLFNAQILIEAEEDTEITFKYIFNDNEDVTFMPAQIMAAGKHIITLFYPLSEIPANTRNNLKVQASVSEGRALIDAFFIKASIMGQGLAEGAAEWDGTIEIEQEITPLNIVAITIKPFTENTIAALQTPTAGAINQSFSALSLSNISIVSFTEHIGSGEAGHESGEPEFVIERAIVEFTTPNDYIKREDGQIKLQNNYEYISEAEAIDNGLMCAVTVVTDDKQSIESIGVTNGEL